MIVGQAATLGAIGVAIGSAAPCRLAPLLRSQLYGIRSFDPDVRRGAGRTAAIAALAALVPARRAMSDRSG